MSNRYRPVWAPDAIDIETPSAARMYDYFLGGYLLGSYIVPVGAGCINALRPHSTLTFGADLRGLARA